MTVNVKLYRVIIVFLLVLSVVFFVGRCSTHRQIDNALEAAETAQKQLKEAAVTYQVFIDGQKQVIAEQKTVIMTKEQALRSEIISKDKYKKLHLRTVRENVRLLGEIRVLKDSLQSVPGDTVILYDTIMYDSDIYLKLPALFSYKDDYVSLTTNINADVSWGFDLKVPLDLNVTLGEKRTGWFGSEPTVFISPENPYITDIRIQTVHIQAKPRFYETLWFKTVSHVASFATGYYLGGR